MTRKQVQQVTSNILTEASLGIGLFLGGLFLTIGTWGVMSPIGIPMMVLSVAAPLWIITKDPRGKIWGDKRPASI